MRPTMRLLTIFLLGSLLVGCGGSRVKARGRLVKNGEPFVPNEKETVHVAFFPAGEESQSSDRSYVVKFNRADGTFLVSGADGKGLPPGKYRVTVALMKDRTDALKGAFNAKNSPLVCEVKNTSDEITVDLAAASKANSPADSAKGTRANPPADSAKGIRKSRS